MQIQKINYKIKKGTPAGLSPAQRAVLQIKHV